MNNRQLLQIDMKSIEFLEMEEIQQKPKMNNRQLLQIDMKSIGFLEMEEI